MGDRGEVIINGVHLYTHSGGSCLISSVKHALAKHARWNDISYLARIIFCSMLGDDIAGTAGFGIGISVSDAWRVITLLDGENAELVVRGNGIVRFEGSFQDFLDWEEC